LERVTCGDQVVFNGSSFAQRNPEPLNLSLTAATAPVSRIRVNFLTPTEIKSADCLLSRPDFGALLSRLRDRISTLRALYGEGPLAIDFREFGARAARVATVACEVSTRSTVRLSTRTGQRHPLAGFTGWAEFEGEITEFLPYLRAGRHTGVGRQTVWGHGEIETDVLG
jgi:hypothetical protein